MNDSSITGPDINLLRERTFYGREKENLINPIALANLGLHGINQPNLWHGNALTRQVMYDGLFQTAEKFGCSPSTVNKAVKSSADLTEWAKKQKSSKSWMNSINGKFGDSAADNRVPSGRRTWIRRWNT